MRPRLKCARWSWRRSTSSPELADVDVLVMPTCLMTAPKNHRPGTYFEAVEDNLMSASSPVSRNTQPFNYTGHPALATPVGKSAAGLPVSMQLVGRFFDDALLMRVAYAYQHSTDWDKLTGIQPTLAAAKDRAPDGVALAG